MDLHVEKDLLVYIKVGLVALFRSCMTNRIF